MNNPYVRTLGPVWENTKNVTINEKMLQKLIRDMKQKKENGELIIPAWDTPNAQPPIGCSLTEWLNYVCTANTINFAFSNFNYPCEKFSIEYPKGVFWKGAFAMGASLMRAREENIPIFDAWYLSEISIEDVGRIFRSIDEDHQIPMFRQRWEIFREIGKILASEYDGSWLDLFEKANWLAFNNGKGIVEQLVANFPSFRDTRVYGGRLLEFHKRAQLLVMEYYGRAFNSKGAFPIIGDIEDIGPIADYEVPKALEYLSVLEYSPNMKAAIQSHFVFSPDDAIEVENRLAMSCVMKKICDEVGIGMPQADYYIWEIGRKAKSPHILVPTINY
ncbi:MAG: hypothetical protein HYT20_01325 [Candidatus Nealsonbacteria bacterium]|nr:hypothetical protein [Candidatus Nealsonbacteria bacterium]